MIRHIQPNELGWLVSLANCFSIQYMGKPVDHTNTTRTLEQLIYSGVALRSDSGAIVGMFMDDPYYSERHLVELGWFALDRSGLALLRRFEQEGKAAGVHSIRMTTLQTSPPGVARLLQRRGYTALEHSWALNTRETTNGIGNTRNHRAGY